IALRCGPRHCGQSSAATGWRNARTKQTERERLMGSLSEGVLEPVQRTNGRPLTGRVSSAGAGPRSGVLEQRLDGRARAETPRPIERVPYLRLQINAEGLIDRLTCQQGWQAD